MTTEQEAWLAFRRHETADLSTGAICHDCGAPCTGDTTTDDNGKEVPVCDGDEGCLTSDNETPWDPDEDGQPTDLQEHQDFAHDDDQDNSEPPW